jgi:hypothetical protein
MRIGDAWPRCACAGERNYIVANSACSSRTSDPWPKASGERPKAKGPQDMAAGGKAGRSVSQVRVDQPPDNWPRSASHPGAGRHELLASTPAGVRESQIRRVPLASAFGDPIRPTRGSLVAFSDLLAPEREPMAADGAAPSESVKLPARQQGGTCRIRRQRHALSVVGAEKVLVESNQ